MTTPIAPGTVLPLRAADGLLHLSGRAGWTVSLQPGGDVKQVSWEPDVVIDAKKNRKMLAKDYDLQVQWLSTGKPANNPPLVYWRIQYGHGELSYALPVPSACDENDPVVTNRAVQPAMILPNRGLRLRIPGREIRLFFYSPPRTLPPPEPTAFGGETCTLQASFQPCCGLEPEVLPYTDACMFPVAVAAAPALPVQLPLGCSEMRFADPFTGLPFPAATSTIEFLDASGATLPGSPLDASGFAQFTSIPLFAAYWLCVNGEGELGAQVTQAVYR